MRALLFADERGECSAPRATGGRPCALPPDKKIEQSVGPGEETGE
ncbi:hypothetical protein OHB49_15100 [Streptomyces sp. NBC_01717]|nr:hypothetical protein [Streptomyces sp. NBC_01717]